MEDFGFEETGEKFSYMPEEKPENTSKKNNTTEFDENYNQTEDAQKNEEEVKDDEFAKVGEKFSYMPGEKVEGSNRSR